MVINRYSINGGGAPVDPRVIITDEDFESQTPEADIGDKIIAAYENDPYVEVIWNVTEGSSASYSGRYYIKSVDTTEYNLFTLYGLGSKKLIRLYFNESNNELQFFCSYQIEDGIDVHINVEGQCLNGVDVTLINRTNILPYTYAEFDALMTSANNKTITGRIHGTDTDYCIVEQARFYQKTIDSDTGEVLYKFIIPNITYDKFDENDIPDPRNNNGYNYGVVFEDTADTNFGTVRSWVEME